MEDKIFYRRNLPHYQPKDGVFAITTRLSGTLPKAIIQELREERDFLIKKAETEGYSEEEITSMIASARELYFGKFDDLLDGISTGPTWLANPKIAKILVESFAFIDGRFCEIVAYCIMSNHIHVVMYKCQKQLHEIMGSFKKYTGRMANEIIYGPCPKGEERPAFWQQESYDHAIRDRREFGRQVNYVLNNPVKAGLVKNWQDWKWTYASPTALRAVENLKNGQ